MNSDDTTYFSRISTVVWKAYRMLTIDVSSIKSWQIVEIIVAREKYDLLIIFI